MRHKKLPIIVLISFVFYILPFISSFNEIKATSSLPNITFLEGTSSNQNNTNPHNAIVLYNANLIDGVSSQAKHNQTIIVNEGKIIDIIDNKHIVNNVNYSYFHKNYPNSNLIDLSGMYIIPGLFDMHAHVGSVLKNTFNKTFSEKMISNLIGYGVTTIRNPAGPTEESVNLRESASSGKIIGPQILTAGRLLNSPLFSIPFVEKEISTVEEVREEVDSQADAGVDFIKLYVGLEPHLVKEAISIAHSHGIKAIGHLYLTSWTDAANMNIDFLTHGVPVNPYLLSPKDRKIFEINGGNPFDHVLWLEMVDIEGKEIDEMIDSLVENNVYVDPTLSIYEAMIEGNLKEQSIWPKVLQLTKKMYDKGVKILSGTDIPNFELVPGKSLHNELELLVDAGIPSSEVLKIATRNGAESMGLSNQTGAIEKGKQADILVLQSNPIEDISNTQDISMVISDGEIIDRNKALSK
ncbi:MAG TPA: amidohydrolase family protein [Bacillales bacterium]|nr:amidohydrolase family protein [Bacillales bacterium]